MGKQADFERNMGLAKQALSLMEERRAAVTPLNFEIWYNYVTGENDHFKQEIDKVIAQHGSVSDAAAIALHEKHFSANDMGEKVDELSKQMSGELDLVTQAMTQAAGQTSVYGQSLDFASEALDGADGDMDETALKAIVQNLAASTNEMERNNQSLEARLQESKAQIANLNKTLKDVRQESLTDQLTSIANRKCFDEQIKQAVNEAQEEKSDCCLLMGDVDFFKKFNDTFGHQTGDQVLRFVARSIKTNVKGRDLAARYGGEEFVVILPQTDLIAAKIVADHIRESISAKALIKKSTSENLGIITMSFGAALYRPGEDIDDFIARADACLYQAKDAGRDRVICESPSKTNPCGTAGEPARQNA